MLFGENVTNIAMNDDVLKSQNAFLFSLNTDLSNEN